MKEGSCNGLHKLDIFGKDVNLTFQGKQSYTSKFGGIWAIISFAVILILFG